MKKKLGYLVIASSAMVLMIVFQNCSQPSELEYADMNQSSLLGLQTKAIEILNTNCFACHNSGNAQGGVTSITDPGYLISTGLVVPGEPDLSPAIIEIMEGRMPTNGTVNNSDLQVLREWVIQLSSTPISVGPPPTQAPLTPNYSVLAARVFGPRCATCHSARADRFGNYAETTSRRVGTNGFMLVNPGSPELSRLYIAITTGLNGGRMPQGGQLSAAEIENIRLWILNGAQQN